MKINLYFLIVLICVSLNAQIPRDINESIDFLKRDLPLSYQDSIKKLDEHYYVSTSHMSLGFKLRGIWGLRSGSKLKEYFVKQGINEPDNMSGIILTSFHRSLNEKKIELNGQIKKCKESHLAQKKPLKSSFPKEAKDIDLNIEIDYPKANHSWSKAYIGKAKESEMYWLYEYYFGWIKIDEQQYNRFAYSYDDEKENLLTEIFKKN